MLTLDQPQILINTNTELRLTSDHGLWVPGNSTVQPTTFSIAGAGGSIVSEYIVDRFNAILTIAGTSTNLLTITDTINNEAVSVEVWSGTTETAEITSEGDTQLADANPPGDDIPPPPINVPGA